MAWPQKASLIVVSDVHLLNADDTRGTLLQTLLKRLETMDLETFVPLGDIFDFGLGSSSFYRKKFMPIGQALTRLAQTGTRVLFFEGNHEFKLTRFGWQNVEVIEGGDYILELSDGTKIKLTHGDMLFPSKVYAAFRKVVKSGPVTTIASLVPGGLLDRLTLKSAEISRAQDDTRKMDHEGLITTANHWLNQDDTHHGIFGHFHVPYAETRQNGNGKILSVESWDNPNFLAYESGEFYRGFLQSDGELTNYGVAKPFLNGLKTR